MLQIRSEQMTAFEQAALRRFEDEMVLHSQDFSPRLCEVIGEEQLRVALRQSMDRAGSHGFTYRGSILLFADLMFLFGSAFDTDPQYPWAAEVLQSPAEQIQRAEELRYRTLDYQEKVAGPNGVNVRRALEEVSIVARQPLPFSSSQFAGDMLREMQRVFPQKAAYVGDKGLTALIEEASVEAQRRGFSTVQGRSLLVVLKFAFGHGCTDDPLYPWIVRTLEDERIIEPTARAERLQKKAVTWLDHVLARQHEGALK
jgi:hypothetical protein